MRKNQQVKCRIKTLRAEVADAIGPEMRTSLTCSRYREVRIVGVGRGAAERRRCGK